MKILYDDAAFREPHGGVSRYFTELIKHLPDGFEPMLAVKGTDNEYLNASPFCVPKPELSFRSFLPGIDFRGKSIMYRIAYSFMPRIFPAIERDNAIMFSNLLADCDVVHITSPHWSPVKWRNCRGKPLIVTVHDLIPELLLNDRRTRNWRFHIMQAAKKIIAVSENTKDDLLRLYNLNPEKIVVIPHGCDGFKHQDSNPLFPGLRYILFIGRRAGYKNFDFFITSVAKLLQKDKDLKVVCSGLPFTASEMRLLDKLGIEKQVIQKFIPDESMESSLHYARCFVYPSQYEGFGIPILDAFSARCPVVLSRSSCFPEVGGDAAEYFENGDTESLRHAVSKATYDESARQSMILKGIDRSKCFSWDKTAQETAAVYLSALNTRRDV